MKSYTTTETASILNISRSWVRYLILRKKLPATKMGRDWIINEEDLMKFKEMPRKVGRPKKED